MGKLADLKRAVGSTARESMGAGGAIGGQSAATPERMVGVGLAPGVLEVPLAKIRPDPDQPRKEFDDDALARLAANLRSRGQLQPIRVRWDGRRKAYLIVAGERRYRAATRAGLESLVCVVDDRPAAAEDTLIDQLAENCAREGLAPLELAAALHALHAGHGLSTYRIAEETGLSQATVSQCLALLDAAPAVQGMVEAGELPASTAYEIAKLPDPADQEELATRAAGGGLTRDRVRAEVKSRRDGAAPIGGQSSEPRPGTLSTWSVIPPGRETPAYYIRAVTPGRARAVLDCQGHPDGDQMRLVPLDPTVAGSLPADCCVLTDGDESPPPIGGQSPPGAPPTPTNPHQIPGPPIGGQSVPVAERGTLPDPDPAPVIGGQSLPDPEWTERRYPGDGSDVVIRWPGLAVVVSFDEGTPHQSDLVPILERAWAAALARRGDPRPKAGPRRRTPS